MILRPYQVSAVEAILGHWAAGVRRVLCVLPTGGGKTVLATEVIRRALPVHGHALMLAHRRELVKQPFCRLVRSGFSPHDVGVVLAGTPSRTDPSAAPPETLKDKELWEQWGRRRPRAPVHVGSIDTLRGAAHPEAGQVIIDEAHRALSKSYRDVDAYYPGARILGLTATPMRGDGRGMGEAFDVIVVVASYMDLVPEHLVEPRCFGTARKADLSGVKRSKGDYDQAELANAVDRAELVGDIVEHWKSHGENQPTFCFAVSVEHSKHLAARFNAAGIPARHVDGGTDTDERDDAIQALQDGRCKVLCNCNVFTEGTDVPCVGTIILARPTLSEGLYLQQAGRGSRPYPGKKFVVLDHAGCCTAFGLPQEWREYSLDAKPKRASKGTLPPAKDCPSCYAVVPTPTKVCPECGYEWPADEEPKGPPTEKAGKLVELTPGQSSRLGRWDALVAEWRSENGWRMTVGEKLLAPGWCTAQWRVREQADWPPKGSKIPKLSADETAYEADREARAEQARREAAEARQREAEARQREAAAARAKVEQERAAARSRAEAERMRLASERALRRAAPARGPVVRVEWDL